MTNTATSLIIGAVFLIGGVWACACMLACITDVIERIEKESYRLALDSKQKDEVAPRP